MFEIEKIEVRQNPVPRVGEGKWNQVGSYSGKSLIYVHIKDETVAEQLIYRRSRPTKVYREVINQVRAEIEASEYRTRSSISPFTGEEQGNLLMKPVNLSDFVWKQTAGCSCGCSPAFVVNSDRGRTITITVTGIVNPVDATVQDRASQFGMVSA
jgi:hypothetical protein